MSASGTVQPSAVDRFFVIGGTLRADAASYVERTADVELIRALQEGDFCYVLNSRQIGKSSLMVRASLRLSEAGISVAVLDLTRLGRNVTPEQWYFGLLLDLASQFGASKPAREYWTARTEIGPLNRWFQALEACVLPGAKGNVVIFVDEIDYVRSLPFATDEFFAGIRELYNRRASEPELKRVTFCLLGVAAPSELISDPRMTPFNVGRRIELEDFTAAEAAPLAAALSDGDRDGKALLAHALHWTSGHPYLTQRLCKAIADDASVRDAKGVDRLVDDLFLSSKSRATEDNFAFVQHRMVSDPELTGALLHQYGQILRGGRVKDDDATETATLLKLAGVVRSDEGRLVVRNRLYATVFDPAWIRANTPGAELRRARVAFWKGLAVAGSVGLVSALVLGIAFLQASRLRSSAEDRARQVSSAMAEMNVQDKRLKEEVYAARMRAADIAYREGNAAGARAILAEVAPKKGEEDLRGFEWGRLWHLTESNSLVLRGLQERPIDVAVSPDAQSIAAVGRGGRLIVWSLKDGKESGSVRMPYDLFGVAYSRDARRLAVGDVRGTVTILDSKNLQRVSSFETEKREARCLVFLPADEYLAVANVDGMISLYEVRSRRLVDRASVPGLAVGLALSPDGKTLAASSSRTTFFDVSAHSLSKVFDISGGGTGLDFSPDGTRCFFGDGLGRLYQVSLGGRRVEKTYNVGRVGSVGLAVLSNSLLFAASSAGDGQLVAIPEGKVTAMAAHREPIAKLARDAKRDVVATASWDLTVRVWRQLTDRSEPEAIALGATVDVVRFAKDGIRMATSESNGTISLWSRDAKRPQWTQEVPSLDWATLALDPLERFVAVGSKHKEEAVVNILDFKTGKGIANWGGHLGGIRTICFSPDASRVLVVGFEGIARIRRVEGWAPIGSLNSERLGVFGAAWSGDSKTIALACYDKGLKLYDADTLSETKAYEGRFSCVAFSADGRRMAAGGMDGSVRLWDRVSGLEIRTDRTGLGPATAIAFTPDSKTLASTGEGGTIFLWNAASGREVGRIEASRGTVLSLDFSPDGRTLASGGREQVVHLWRASMPQNGDAL